MNDYKIVSLIKDLISIPSYVTEDNNENKIIDFIYKWLKDNSNAKVEKQLIPGGRFNLIVKKGKPEVVFLAHTDTVNVSQNAKFNQLEPREYRKQIWGRGATDMKSGVASLMIAISEASRSNNFWAFFYADEEYDFLGMKELIKKYGYLKPKLIISADGSDLQIGHGCRGLIEMTLRIKGETGHPAKGTGNSAIWGTYECLSLLKSFLNKYSHQIMGTTSFNLAYVLGGAEISKSILENKLVDVGKAGNVIPDICEFTIDVRPANSDLNSKIIIKFLVSEFRKLKLNMDVVEIKHDLGAWYSSESEIKNFINNKNKFSDCKKTGYLDLQMFWDKVGRPPAFMFGGGIGDTAHKSDERIKIKDLFITKNFFSNFMQKLK